MPEAEPTVPAEVVVPTPIVVGTGSSEPARAVWDLAEGDPLVLQGYTDTERFNIALPAGWRAEATSR